MITLKKVIDLMVIKRCANVADDYLNYLKRKIYQSEGEREGRREHFQNCYIFLRVTPVFVPVFAWYHNLTLEQEKRLIFHVSFRVGVSPYRQSGEFRVSCRVHIRVRVGVFCPSLRSRPGHSDRHFIYTASGVKTTLTAPTEKHGCHEIEASISKAY